MGLSCASGRAHRKRKFRYNELGLDGLLGPARQGLRIFDHVNGYLIEGFQCLFGVRTEGFHAVVFVIRCSSRRDFEIQVASMEDAEKLGFLIETVAAEHGARGKSAQIGQLIHDEVFEAVMLRRHSSSGHARRNHPHCDRQCDD